MRLDHYALVVAASAFLGLAFAAYATKMVSAIRRKRADRAYEVTRVFDQDEITVIPSHEATDPTTYAMMRAMETGRNSWVTVEDGIWYDGDLASQGRCGVINPRTKMICETAPHNVEGKHWTIGPDGERYDWFVHEDGSRHA